MTDAAIIRATFSEWRMIKGRKVLQIVCEVPLEAQETVLRALGTPGVAEDNWVAIARLDPEMLDARREAEEQAQDAQFTTPALDTPRARKPLSQVAAVLCGVVAFRRYLTEECGAHIAGADEAADWLRSHCGVKSRRELDHNDIAAAKFKRLRDQYDIWMRVVA